MFASFIESVKYVGHLVPLSFLRIYLGYHAAVTVLQRIESDHLSRPRLAAEVADLLPTIVAPNWYKNILEFVVIPHWQVFAFLSMTLTLAVAVSYVIGYVVRPMAVIAALMTLNLMILAGNENPQLGELRIMLALHILMAWIGAGRCLGVDYYFYKRRRGIWW